MKLIDFFWGSALSVFGFKKPGNWPLPWFRASKAKIEGQWLSSFASGSRFECSRNRLRTTSTAFGLLTYGHHISDGSKSLPTSSLKWEMATFDQTASWRVLRRQQSFDDHSQKVPTLQIYFKQADFLFKKWWLEVNEIFETSLGQRLSLVQRGWHFWPLKLWIRPWKLKGPKMLDVSFL